MNSREQVFNLDSLPDFHSPLINRGDSVRTLLKIEHTVTSVEKNVNDLDVKIYPNPANNTIYVDFAELPDIKSIQVINLNGRILKQFPSEVLPKIGLLKISLENLSSGLYFLQVETNNIIKTLTFIKQ
jgi:hypothetical protein